MMVLPYVLVLILGLAAGVFINICIYRIPDRKPLFAKLPDFSTLLSVRPLLVELLTAVIYILLYTRFGFTVGFFAFAYLMLVLIAAAFIDIDHRIIPDELVIAGLAGGAAIFMYNIMQPGHMMYGDNRWWSPLAGLFSGSGVLLLVAVIGLLIYKTDDAMGMGDVKLMAPIGVFLGWKLCFLALFTGIIIAGTASFILILVRIKKKKDTIPFGPYLVGGAFIAVMWGWNIANWYISLL